MSTSTTIAQPAPASSLRQWIQAHPVAAFLFLVYGLGWLIFLTPLLSDGGIGLLHFDLPIQVFILPTSILALSFPAFLVTRIIAGREGVRELRSHYLRWRVGIGWYLLVLIGLPLLCVLGAALWQGLAPLQAFAANWTLLFTALLPNAVVIAVLVSIWEEGGWTGFLLHRLQPRLGPVGASLALAPLQGLLHIPLLFIVGGLNDGGRIAPADYGIYLLFLFVFTMPFRVLVTWLWNSTRGSLVIVALFHGVFNTLAGGTFVSTLVAGDAAWVYAVLAVLAVIVIVATRGRLGYTGQPAATAPVAEPAVSAV